MRKVCSMVVANRRPCAAAHHWAVKQVIVLRLKAQHKQTSPVNWRKTKRQAKHRDDSCHLQRNLGAAGNCSGTRCCCNLHQGKNDNLIVDRARQAKPSIMRTASLPTGCTRCACLCSQPSLSSDLARLHIERKPHSNVSPARFASANR